MSDNVKLQKTEILSHDRYNLKKVTFDYLTSDGEWHNKSREVYDIGNATTALLYNRQLRRVILTRQFRIATFLNGNEDGMMIESCAGKLDGESPETAIIREIEEETGYEIPSVKKIFEAFMTPGSVAELVHFFIGEYSASMKVSAGGGLKDEQEDIEVLDLEFEEVLHMIGDGQIKDAKTILLVQYAKIHELMK